ncbi:hypothetical protein EW145_g3014 [Phellinidium pouzarii]|uniref:VanZ-like domain-containing protein n=1 Tax=Phellinidium pouzarii TaxID=167371 RepID=A0A4S4L8N5_9AGAM|nr:hypothetical protein EW145_g3014 [Phellinidium pouzarii]
MLGLSSPATQVAPGGSGSGKSMRKTARRAFRSVMRSYKFKLPKVDFPLRLRPWFVLFTVLIMLVLVFLGFTNFSHSLPLNDKIIHLFAFSSEELSARSFSLCFQLSSLRHSNRYNMLNEDVQYKEFQMGDVAANLIGSAIGLWTAYYLERYYRHRREISRLYRPVSLDPDEFASEDEDEDEQGTMLLSIHHSRGQNEASSMTPKSSKGGRIRLGDVWDERDELFGVGDSEDEDEEAHMSQPIHHHALSPSPQQSAGPKIVVTGS